MTSIRSADELELSLLLEEWEASQSSPPTIFDVVETGDRRLLGAYILRGFRQAARQAVQENQRVMELREFAWLAFEKADAAEDFLRASHPALNGRTPLQGAVHSAGARDAAILQMAPRLRGAAVRLLERLSRAWDLNDEELARLAGSQQDDLLRWRENPERVPISAVQRVAALLGIFRATKALFPEDSSAGGWIRQPGQLPQFRGSSALMAMLQGGLPAIQEVRRHLDAELGRQ